MIGALNPYARTKSSGEPWLGKLPEHRSIRKIRTVLKPVTERNRADLPLLSVVRERGVILRDVSSKDENPNYIPEDLSNYKVVHAGQFAMNKMKAWQGSYGGSQYDGIVSPAYFVFDVTGVATAYFHAATRSRAYVPFFTQASDGVRIGQWDLSQARMKEIPFAIPPEPEQAAIVRYLNHADRRIRRYIRAKQKLIALLEERKQAIIRRVVTRGRNPDVPLKPSGVTLLGDVPQHWDVKRLCHLLDPTIRLAYGILLPGPRLEDGVPYLGAGDVRKDRLRLDLLPRTTSEIAGAYPRTKMRAGELAYAIRGSFGNAEVIPADLEGVNLSRDAARIAPREGIDPHWLAFAIKSPACQEQFQSKEIGATVTGVNIRDLKRVVLPVPPPSEQAVIARALAEETATLDGLIGREYRGTRLLREYRTCLVANVVTGKVDVREAAADLPEEADEAEPPDEFHDSVDNDEELVAKLDGATEGTEE